MQWAGDLNCTRYSMKRATKPLCIDAEYQVPVARMIARSSLFAARSRFQSAEENNGLRVRLECVIGSGTESEQEPNKVKYRT